MSAAEQSEWTGRDVTISEIERELAQLRSESMHLRTSMMTHLAWAPPEWQDAARETLAGLAELHPSRTILLFPQEGGRDALDADVALECYSLPEVERNVCSEVIELRLHGSLANSPVSVVLPLVLPDLPVFLRWRGRPVFGRPAFEQLVDVVDRLVVDSREWDDVLSCYPELVPYFERVAISDIVWGRTLRWRRAIAELWPAIREAAELHIRGPLPEATLLRGWLASRLGRDIALRHELAEHVELLGIDGHEVIAREERTSASDLLSNELDRFSRDEVYERAVAAAKA
ncbi:MAG TPA: glucose-6-phosphate dehydrogenase assembly protein OpcA [Gaiellaceae bacterium]|nr:glucose-6-phosphate dehydrogenase assembly protein OpcA [Gaiellaceae bacterium]